MTHFINDIKIENNLTYSTNSPELDSVATTTDGTFAMTVTDHFVQVLTGSATGFSVVLPDATTLTNGWKYEIFNTSSQTVILKDKTGTSLGTISQTTVAYVMLQSNATTAGTWIYWQRFIGTADSIVNYTVTSSTLFETTSSAAYVPITEFSVVPTEGRYAVWYNASAFSNKNNLLYYCMIYKGTTPVTDSERAFLGISSSYQATQSTMCITDFNGVDACSVYVKVGVASGNTLQVTNRSLLLIRLGNVLT